MFLPTQEIKHAAEQAQRTLSEVQAAIADARTVLRHAAGIAEDLRAITSAMRTLVTRA